MSHRRLAYGTLHDLWRCCFEKLVDTRTRRYCGV